MKQLGKQVTYFEVGYKELEKLIRKEYKSRKYSFVADRECGNDSTHTFTIAGKEDLDEYDFEELKTGKRTNLTHVYLQDMVNRDVIPAGNYLIVVCW